jgi:hypothetical protein
LSNIILRRCPIKNGLSKLLKALQIPRDFYGFSPNLGEIREIGCTKYGTHHSYVLVVHTLRVAENEILKLDLPAKRH